MCIKEMKVQENIDKILWTAADKVLYVMYGFVSIFQIRAMSLEDYGLFGLLIGVHSYIFVISDSFALNNMIQFGTFPKNQGKVNSFAFILHSVITLLVSVLLYSFRSGIADVFGEVRLTESLAALPMLTLLTIPKTFCTKLILRERAFIKLFFSNLAFFGTMSFVTFYLIIQQGTISFPEIVNMYYWGTGASALLSIIITANQIKFGTKGEISYRSMLKFSVPMSLYAAFHTLPRNLDTYIAKLFFPLSTVGIYNSAKTLYRLFEEANNATFSLIYPVAVRQMEFGNKKNVMDIMTKAISFMLIPIILIVIILQLGVSDWLITTFLPSKYHLAVGQFNLLMLGAIFLPLSVLTSIITASGKPAIVLKYVFSAAILSIAALVLIGLKGNSQFIPLGIVIYTVSLGIMCYFYIHKNMEMKFSYLFRFFRDTYNFLKKK